MIPENAKAVQDAALALERSANALASKAGKLARSMEDGALADYSQDTRDEILSKQLAAIDAADVDAAKDRLDAALGATKAI